jgi:hypothetical protein
MIRIMADGGAKDQDKQSLLTISFDISPTYQKVIDTGVVMVRELTGKPQLTTEQYITFMLVNAYYYAKARKFRAKDNIEMPSHILQIIPDNEPFPTQRATPRLEIPQNPVVNVLMPETVHTTLTEQFESLKQALETMDVFLTAYIQGKRVQLEFPGRQVIKFPFVRSLEYIEPNLPIIKTMSI